MTITNDRPETGTDIVDRIKVIDCDTHVIEPYDLWTSRVSVKKWGNLVPHVRWDDDHGKDMWYFGDTPVWHAAGAAMAGHDGYPPNQPRTLDEAQSYTWDARERLGVMDQYGIHAAILYPNVSGFGMGRFTSMHDPELMLECIRAYNDFLTDFGSIAPDRYIAVSALPFWDVEEAVKEMERCAAMGHRGVIMGSQPEIFGQPPIGEPHWDRVFAAAQEMELSINFHIGAGDLKAENLTLQKNSNGKHANYAKMAVQFFLGNSNAIGEVIVSGLCHRFPDLKFVSVESGVGWIPFFLEAMDWQWKNCGVRFEHPEYDLLPSEYFKRQIYGCFWFEDDTLKDTIERLGPDNILYESDFPHPTSMAPGPASTAVTPREFIENRLGDLPPDVLSKILHDNAAKLYKL